MDPHLPSDWGGLGNSRLVRFRNKNIYFIIRCLTSTSTTWPCSLAHSRHVTEHGEKVLLRKSFGNQQNNTTIRPTIWISRRRRRAVAIWNLASIVHVQLELPKMMLGSVLFLWLEINYQNCMMASCRTKEFISHGLPRHNPKSNGIWQHW